MRQVPAMQRRYAGELVARGLRSRSLSMLDGALELLHCGSLFLLDQVLEFRVVRRAQCLERCLVRLDRRLEVVEIEKAYLLIERDGKLAGVNQIQSEYGGCVLHERYDTGKGYAGESLNTYDPGSKRWHQTWVDNQGTLLLLDGGLRGASMVLEGETRDAAGVVTRHRITWTPNPDGSVRQHWESASTGGTWSTAFDGKYTRK